MHNLVVCTLCSCYPRAVLGYPPFWYKSAAFRARAIRDPRELLASEWKTIVPDGVKLRVVDFDSGLSLDGAADAACRDGRVGCGEIGRDRAGRRYDRSDGPDNLRAAGGAMLPRRGPGSG